MPQKFIVKKGFIKLQRLGPIKFAEQSRWSIRAPETSGMWAFPYPHFDLFYAYHRYTDLLPKELKERLYPKEAKWYRKDYHDYAEPVDSITFREEQDEFDDEPVSRPFWRDEDGSWKHAYAVPEYYEAQEKWIEEVGKKILPLRTFWYSGDLYTHFKPDGSTGSGGFKSADEVDWTLMNVESFARHMARGGVKVHDGNYDGAGKPRSMNYSSDHLEVFIPRGRGIIRDKL